MATYYISPSGNDTTGDGTTGTPWLTINKANTESAIGDTIILKAGTYTGWDTYGDMDESRIYQGETDANNYPITIMDNSGSALSSGGYVWGSINGNTYINNILWKRADHYSSGNFRPLFAIDCGLYRVYANGCVFDDLEGYVSAAKGGVWSGSNKAGSVRTSLRLTMTGCLVFDTVGLATPLASTSDAMFLAQVRTNTSRMDLELYNNTFFVSVDFTAIITGQYNFVDNPLYSDIVIKNNIFYMPTDVGTQLAYLELTTGMDEDYNCFYNISDNPGVYNYSFGSNTIEAEPLFVDRAGGNYNPRPSSPTVGAGITI